MKCSVHHLCHGIYDCLTQHVLFWLTDQVKGINVTQQLRVDRETPLMVPKACWSFSCCIFGVFPLSACLSCLQVSILARKLPVGDIKAMAAQLGSAQGPAAAIDTSDLNEDDLT